MQWVTEALNAYGEYFRRMATEMLARDGSFGENLEALLLSLADSMAKTKCTYGCPIGAVLLDLNGNSEELREVCAQTVFQWQAIFEQYFPALSAERRRDLASFIVSSIEGSLMLSRMEGSARPLRSAAAILRRQVERELADAPG